MWLCCSCCPGRRRKRKKGAPAFVGKSAKVDRHELLVADKAPTSGPEGAYFIYDSDTKTCYLKWSSTEVPGAWMIARPSADVPARKWGERTKLGVAKEPSALYPLVTNYIKNVKSYGCTLELLPSIRSSPETLGIYFLTNNGHILHCTESGDKAPLEGFQLVAVTVCGESKHPYQGILTISSSDFATRGHKAGAEISL